MRCGARSRRTARADALRVGADGAGTRARRLRLAAGFGLALCAGCSPGLVHYGLFSTGHASFEEAAGEFPELGDVARAFDRAVSPAPAAAERERQLDLFAEIFGIAYTEHVEPVSAQALALLALEGFEAAEDEAGLRTLAGGNPAPADDNPLAADRLMDAGLDGMLAGLDPHSTYLEPETYGEMQLRSSGQFAGIGIEVTMEDGLVKIVAPIDGTPGQRAGLQGGDLITHVDGRAVLGLSLADAVKMMRGPAGSSVRLRLRRPPAEEAFTVAVTRATVHIRPVRARAEGRVGYVRVSAFNERAEEGVRRAVRNLAWEIDNEVGYVVDLRSNPGGLLDQALGVADVFLAGGEVASTRGRDRESARRFYAGPKDMSGGLPLIVLIDEASASGAEIVSGALQDHGRALVVGARSFGKGSVQTVVPVSGGGAVRLTTALYYTPSGRSIQSTGIAPDIVAERPGGAARREADLANALPPETAAPGAPGARALADVCPDQAEAEDPALACALHLLEGRRVLAGTLE